MDINLKKEGIKMVEAGRTYLAKIIRKTDIGYMVKVFEDEIFLHKNQTPKDRILKDNEEVSVFIYYDNKRRISATMENSLIELGEKKWLTVSGVNLNIGVFINIGISKDILLSKDFLPYDLSLWPKEGDRLFIELKAKKDQLVAKSVNKFDLPKTTEKLEMGSNISAVVMRIFDEGITLYTDNLSVIFVHKTQYREHVHLGETVNAEIISVSSNGYTASLNPHKENLIKDDADAILLYLSNHLGRMSFNTDSSPEEISLVFKMSKKAFKRALGHLYKARIIDFVDGETILVKR